MKKYSLKLSKAFLKGHPREGEPTLFKTKYLAGLKKHTIRENIEYWSKIIDEVNAGIAFLAIEEWSGIPYKSKVVEIDRLYRLGKQIITLKKIENKIEWSIDLTEPSNMLLDVANNDGLLFSDFIDWFFNSNNNAFTGIIIHFTDLKY